MTAVEAHPSELVAEERRGLHVVSEPHPTHTWTLREVLHTETGRYETVFACDGCSAVYE